MPVDSAASERPVTAELRITTEDMLRLATRATDEEAIRDTTSTCSAAATAKACIFTPVRRWCGSSACPGSTISTSPPTWVRTWASGAYNSFVPTRSSGRRRYATLPMSAVTDCCDRADKGTVTLPTLSVRRTVAKIAYNIRVADKVPDLELRSVRLCSVPGRTTLFTPASAPSTSEKDFTDAPLVELPDAARRSCSGVQYLFENPQGTVPSITDQQDKNADNAPSCASYLMIRATRGSRILDYRVTWVRTVRRTST